MASWDRNAKKLVIYCNCAEEAGWKVKLGIENPKTREVEYKDGEVPLRDPWEPREYQDRIAPGSSVASQMGQEESHVTEGLRDYGKSLFDQLKLQDMLKGKVCDRISIHEEFHLPPSTSGLPERGRRKSIHSLLWEVFEHPTIWHLKGPAESTNTPPRITRVLTGQPPGRSIVTNENCRILLVVARSFQYLVRAPFDKRLADAPPGLIQNILLEIGHYLESKGLGSRFSLDVVRPGTFLQLKNFLKAETDAHRKYDLVHFDLHGSISKGSPKLRFGNSKYDLPFLPIGDDVPFVVPDAAGYDEVDVGKVAELLQEHQVTRVALNACLSSSAQHESLPSMAATLIEKGVTSVSAMSYRMLDQTAKIYYDAFYQALILGGKDFHEAAAKGREALRLKSQDPKEWLNPTNYRNRVYTFNNKFQPRRPHLLRWFSLTFFLIYLGVCPWPNTVYHVTSPVIVIPFMRRWITSPSDDMLIFRLKAASFWAAMLIIMAYLALYRQIAPSRALEILRYFIDQGGLIFSKADHCARYRAYLEEQKKQRHAGWEFELSIEHMTIEDQLYSHRGVYLFGDSDAHLDRTVESLSKIWIQTGFIDSAHIKEATDFFEILSRPLSTKRHFNGTVFNDRHRLKRGPRSLVVIKNIHEFVERLNDRKANLAEADETQKMNSWINNHCTAGSYLLITSVKHKDWWLRQNWGEDINKSWGGASPYNPNLFTLRREEALVVQVPMKPYN